jgi:predicted nucleotidyltransferase
MKDQTRQAQHQGDLVVQEFAAALRQRLGLHLRQIVLFGSRARGDAQDGSDYDMLVVVDHRTPELRAVILEVESQLMERYGALVATVLRSEAEWQQLQGLPLAHNIAREGVQL